MSRIQVCAVVMFAALSLEACIVRTGRPANNGRGNSPNCAPAHHWDGNSCVHNGNGNGNGNGRGRGRGNR